MSVHVHAVGEKNVVLQRTILQSLKSAVLKSTVNCILLLLARMDGWTWRPARAIVDGLLDGWNVGLWLAGVVTDDDWVALTG